MKPRNWLYNICRHFFSDRTVDLVFWDLSRYRPSRAARERAGRIPDSGKLHFGSGGENVAGWLNADLEGGEVTIDLACGALPWRDDVFDVAVSRHVIEHLELKSELIPLLRELARCLKPGGELWVSTPDMAKICAAYVADGGQSLVEQRISRHRRRYPGRSADWCLDDYSGMEGTPTSHIINSMFHYQYRHRNLFDYELLEWTLHRAGFPHVVRTDEAGFLEKFPEFKPRHDNDHSLYVWARTGGTPPNSVVRHGRMRSGEA